MIDLGQPILARVRQQLHGLPPGQLLGRGELARGEFEFREFEADLGDPWPLGILIGRGRERLSGRVSLAREPFGNRLEIPQVCPVVAVLGGGFQVGDRRAGRFVLALLEQRDDFARQDDGRRVDRGSPGDRLGGGGRRIGRHPLVRRG